MKKKILVTRKLLQENEEKLKELFDVKLNDKDELYTTEKILELSEDCDGILSAITDQFNKELIEKLSPSIKIIANFAVGFGNIGCMTQIASGIETPIVHTVEVIDWLTGGPKPIKLNNL